MEKWQKTDGSGEIKFIKMGCQIRENNYNGNICNHRIRSYINYNGVNILIEIMSRPTVRKISKNGCKTLKNPIQTSRANGMSIEVYGFHTELIQGCSGKWFVHEVEKKLFEKNTSDKHDKTTHTTQHALIFINHALRTNFTSLVIED